MNTIDNEPTLVLEFKNMLFFVLDSYNKEDECMTKRLIVKTFLPSLKGNRLLEFAIEWDYRNQEWNVESQDETYYGITSNYLINWFATLHRLNVIDCFDWECL